MIHTIKFETRARVDFLDVTSEVQRAVDKSGVGNGVCYVFVPHTTAAVTLNEHAYPDVVRDIAAHLESLAPHHKSYLHGEGNADAHIKASLIGSSQTILVEASMLVLGTWQGVFFCEFDGPRNRTMKVKIVADTS